jgi:hypothetical protein
MSDLVLICPTQGFGKWEENHATWGEDTPKILVRGIRPLTKAYQTGYEEAKRTHPDADILGFVHDDVTVYDQNWRERVLAEFDDPQVGLVGFGGSTGHGVPWIYQSPYEWEQVGRTGVFMSNMINAEQHGARILGSREASVLDGFAMFVRRTVLDESNVNFYDYEGNKNRAALKVKGWPQSTPVDYWCYDYWLSCETRRQGLRARVVGVYCEHTCPPEYRSYVVEENCQEAHKWLYDNYRDTFPAEVANG